MHHCAVTMNIRCAHPSWQFTLRVSLALVTTLAAAAHAQLSPAQQAAPVEAPAIQDLRAEQWLRTRVLNTGSGVVQHTGDDVFPGGTIGFLRERLTSVLPRDGSMAVQLKTADIRLYVPDVRVDEGAVGAAQRTVPGDALLAAPIALLVSSFSKNKSASAVFCVCIDGHDYLGNDARLFRFGAEGELRASIEAAATALARNIVAGTTTTSPACAPGWEGGQPPHE